MLDAGGQGCEVAEYSSWKLAVKLLVKQVCLHLSQQLPGCVETQLEAQEPVQEPAIRRETVIHPTDSLGLQRVGAFPVLGNSAAPACSPWGISSLGLFREVGGGNKKMLPRVRMGLVPPPTWPGLDAMVSAMVNAHFHNYYLAFAEWLFYTQSSL